MTKPAAKPTAKSDRPSKQSKFTKDNCDKVLRFVREGNFLSHAALAAGINPRTVEIWRQQGSDPASPGYRRYRQFNDNYERARALAIADAVRHLKASKDDRTKMWWLARWCPDEWGDKVQVEVQVQFRAKLEEVLTAVETVCGPENAAKVLALLQR